LENASPQDKSFTVNHFVAGGFKYKSIYEILGKFIRKQTAKRKIGSGLNARIMTKPAIRKLKRLFENNDKISTGVVRQLRKFGNEGSLSVVH
jgi:hypothetical protein